MGLFSFAGTPPTDLGVKDGQLKSCPSTPNCVCSYTPESDKEHAIAPISFTGSPDEAIQKLKGIIEGMERSTVKIVSGDYLYAEFASNLMGFVDDVEFYINAGSNVVHTRAAARLGKSDLGVNRKRTEEIRSKFEAAS